MNQKPDPLKRVMSISLLILMLSKIFATAWHEHAHAAEPIGAGASISALADAAAPPPVK